MKEMFDLLTEDHGRIPRGYSKQCLNQSYMFDGKYNNLLLPIGNKFVQLWRFYPDAIGCQQSVISPPNDDQLSQGEVCRRKRHQNWVELE